MRRLIVICFIIFFVFAFCSCGSSDDFDEKLEAAIQEANEEKEAATEEEVVEESEEVAEEKEEEVIEQIDPFELTNGNYTAGLDFHAGIYNLTATAGHGNVSSDNMFDGGINSMMALDGDVSEDYADLYIDSYSNVNLPSGVEIKIEGVVILMEYVRPADGSNEEIIIPEESIEDVDAFDLSNGNYTAGLDFPAGTYNITAIEGHGNVSCDNMFESGINSTMAAEGEVGDDFADMYIDSYQNVGLPDGVVIKVDGVTIHMEYVRPAISEEE